MIALYVLVGILGGFVVGGGVGFLVCAPFGMLIAVIFDPKDRFVWKVIRIGTAVGAILGILAGTALGTFAWMKMH